MSTCCPCVLSAFSHVALFFESFLACLVYGNGEGRKLWKERVCPPARSHFRIKRASELVMVDMFY